MHCEIVAQSKRTGGQLCSHRRLIAVAIAVFGMAAACSTAAWGQASVTPAPPIDAQEVQDQDDMTWADYKPIPGVDWTDPKHVPERTIRIALVVADFEDQPFVVTLPKKSDLFGNPQIDPVPRETVAQFYHDFWNKPQEINHFHTVHEYWMELSHGKIGVEFDAYGPYRMPHKMIEYSGTVNGARGFGGGGGGRGRRGGNDGEAAQTTAGPAGERGAGGTQGERGVGEGDARRGGGRRGGGGQDRPSLQSTLDAMWRPDAGEKEYDLVLRIYAGYDETCVWQEFGEMKFQTREDIPPEWGNPDPTQPRWSGTRYVEWTSWKAGSYLWSNSSIIQGESSGSIRHEISHAAFSIGDNNNNPYVQPYHRAGSGPWDIMDRGSFNGPGGPHNRWQIPVQYGGAMPAGVMLSQQMKFGFLEPSNVVRLNRDELGRSGPVVVRVVPRNVVPGGDRLHGIAIALDGDGDRTPEDNMDTNPLYGGTGYNYYTVEVVQRMGYDSYSPDSGVLIAMNTGTIGDRERLPINEARRGGGRGGRRGGPRGGDGARGDGARGDANAAAGTGRAAGPGGGAETAQPEAAVRGRGARGGGGGGRRTPYFNWVIDAHPEDMNRLDFRRPNGEAVMRTIADYRQLNDALFHAGLNSGSQFEYVDRPNGLHFYVIDLEYDEQGIREYTLGVRSLEGAGPHERGVEFAAPVVRDDPRAPSRYSFTLRNTGSAAPIDAALHLQDTAAHAGWDIYRLGVSVEGSGWSAHLQNALAAVKFGESASIPVFVTPGASPTATLILTATSESDRTKTATMRYNISRP